jgi:hypothetical protein
MLFCRIPALLWNFLVVIVVCVGARGRALSVTQIYLHTVIQSSVREI